MLNQKLIINETSFAKTSKKLLKQLNSLEKPLDFKLTQIQELLAKSLGFRSVFELQKSFAGDIQENSSEEENLTPFTQNFKFQPSLVTENLQLPKLFKNIEEESLINLIQQLMSIHFKENNSFNKRTLMLISTVVQSLIYMRDAGEIILDVDIIRENLLLENIIHLSKHRRDFPQYIRSSLKNYLFSLPSFQESAIKQNETVLEQHGYLQMDIGFALNYLKKIEKNDIVVADYKWFVSEKREEITSMSGGSNITTKKNVTEYYSLNLHSKLHDLDLEDSWLFIPEYGEWIQKLYDKKQLYTIYFSDLLLYSTKIIDPYKKQKIDFILASILNNYSFAGKISIAIQNNFK